jgi:hypothetical protein
LFSKVVLASAAPELQSRNRPAFRLPLFGHRDGTAEAKVDALVFSID